MPVDVCGMMPAFFDGLGLVHLDLVHLDLVYLDSAHDFFVSR